MGYAFISYSTKNQSLADAMHDMLNDCGIETWMAPGDIPVGYKYAQVISRAVKNCSCLILMLSEDAQNSVWVAKEVERAVSYRRPIIPVQLENVTLNDEFEIYISTDQLVAIQKIDKETQEIKSLLSSIRSFVGKTDFETKSNNLHDNENVSVSHKKAKNIELTVWSPVNTDVFLNDKHHLVMRIDHNTGFNYKINSIIVSGSFDLIFVANGFEKNITFDATSIGDRLEYRLDAILSKKEIHDSYDREEAIKQIDVEPTAYAFEQLSEKGKTEDVDLLISILKSLVLVGMPIHSVMDYHTSLVVEWFMKDRSSVKLLTLSCKFALPTFDMHCIINMTRYIEKRQKMAKKFNILNHFKKHLQKWGWKPALVAASQRAG